jgi:hypothetical protein
VPSPVDLIRIDEYSVSNPIMTSILSGHLKYLGQEELRVARCTWQADKFELNLPVHAPFLFWTSPAGLLLAFGTETKTKTIPADGILLVKFQQWAQF